MTARKCPVCGHRLTVSEAYGKNGRRVKVFHCPRCNYTLVVPSSPPYQVLYSSVFIPRYIYLYDIDSILKMVRETLKEQKH